MNMKISIPFSFKRKDLSDPPQKKTKRAYASDIGGGFRRNTGT